MVVDTKEGGIMAIEVMIRRRVKQGHQAKQLVPLILQMRALATYQPGYISGKTLCNLQEPEECVVISSWKAIQDWERWRHSRERAEIDKKIENLTHEETTYEIYGSMVAESQLP
jgi:antibiotic biosynthesis monooxygenase (ABM) superfamily enzyme